VKAYGGSKKAPGTDTIVKDGDNFKIGENINVKYVPLLIFKEGS
jgi:hydroxyacylglutathione hydrolase